MGLGNHTLSLKSNGEVWTWGFNLSGQLGDNTTGHKSSPVIVVGSHSFVEISAGANHTVARKANGEVWSWGNNPNGILGDNTAGNQKSSPVLVVGNHSFVEISAASNHSVARKENGEVWCWGGDNYGQLGDNYILDRSSPVLVVGNHSFVEISSGNTYTIARKVNGEVWAWGYNGRGNLGDNTRTNRSSPVLVIGNHSFVEIFCGYEHTIARKANGEVWTWGRNTYGQLGDNTIVSKSSPVIVVGNHSFVEISAGNYHTLARKANGEIWTWGYNGAGHLGDNTTIDKSSPILVVGSHSFVEMSAGVAHSIARKANGEVWSWGNNSFGQLGDNTIESKSSPVLVVGNHNFFSLSDVKIIEDIEAEYIYPVPRLRIDDDGSYLYVFCDGYTIVFDKTATYLGIVVMNPTMSYGYIDIFQVISGNPYMDFFDPNFIAEVIEDTQNRVVVRTVGIPYDTTQYLSNSGPVESVFYIYPDRYFVEKKWTVNGSITNTGFSPAVILGSGMVSPNNVYENLNTEYDAVNSTNYNDAKYLAVLSNKLNAQMIKIDENGFDSVIHQHNEEDGTLGFSSDGTTETAGVKKFLYCMIVDTTERLEGEKIYSASDRIKMGNQYKDYIWPDPDKGTWVDDLLLPANIDEDGFAEDGAWHIDVDSNNEAKITLDRTRIRPSIILHEFPFQSGSFESPTNHLLNHLKLDDYAANNTLTAEVGPDGGWYNVSGGSARNTNTTGDSIQVIGRGRNLYTQGGVAYVSLAVGSGTVHDNAFFKKGSILFRMKNLGSLTGDPSFLVMGIDENDYMVLFYGGSGNDMINWDVHWGGVIEDGITPIFTSDYELQKEMIFLLSWDSDKNIILMSINGSPVSGSTHAGTPTTSHPAAFYIGYDGAANSNIIIDEIKTFNEAILPFGAFFTDENNSYANPHDNITAFIKGDESNSDPLKIGTGAISIIGSNTTDIRGQTNSALLFDGTGDYSHIPIGNVNATKGQIAFWFQSSTTTPTAYATILCEGDDFTEFSLYRNDLNTSMKFYFGGETSYFTIPDLWDEVWHYCIFKWDAENQIVDYWQDGIQYGPTALSGSTVWTQASTNTFLKIGGYNDADTAFGIMCDITITNNPNTPQIWTAMGKPLHQPTIVEG
jgi:alpha-tubulin suppressor-like RCC1 family protein